MLAQDIDRIAETLVTWLQDMGLDPAEDPRGPHAFRFGSTLVLVRLLERDGEPYVRFTALLLKDFRPNLNLVTRILRLNNEVLYGAFLLFEGDTLAFAVTLPATDLGTVTFRRTLQYVAWIADEYDEEFQIVGGGLKAEELMAGADDDTSQPPPEDPVEEAADLET
jgi:hypothetical protein